MGVANVITTVAEPSIESAEAIFHHPDVALLCVTGGPAVVKAAAQSGKRVIAGGPGNPPVVVDETRGPRPGGAVHHRGRGLRQQPPVHRREGGVRPRVRGGRVHRRRCARRRSWQLDARAIARLTEAAFTFDGPGKGCGRAHVKRDLLGQDASVLAAAAGVRVPAGTELLFGETDDAHPFVQEEQMMPFLPVVRVKCIGAAIAAARGGRARLPAHRDHPHAQRRARDADGARAEHDALRAERRRRWPRSASTAPGTSATRSPRPRARGSRRR